MTLTGWGSMYIHVGNLLAYSFTLSMYIFVGCKDGADKILPEEQI